METFEAGLRDALDEIDRLRAPECIDTVSIGLFAEGRLTDEEKKRMEEHLISCLYCLKQLNDMKEMLYYQRHPVELSPRLYKRLRALYPDRPSIDE
jgi:hypothetical protein